MLNEIKSNPESTVFLVRDMADVRIAISKISNPIFIKEASDIDRSLIGTMVSELCTNIIKYAGRGSVRMAKSNDDGALDIEIWAEDKGPGIPDVELAMKDHYTTGNTLGLGLPGLKRMADDFTIQSEKEQGTVVYVRKRIQGKKKNYQASKLASPSAATASSLSSSSKATLSKTHTSDLWDVGFFNRPMAGEVVSGDSISIIEFDKYLLLAIADVSGHGLNAHKLGTVISNHIVEFKSKNIASLMKSIHNILVGTLGAAVGLFLVDTEAHTFEYLSVGNTNACRCVGDSWKGLPRDGILGHRLPGVYLQEGTLRNGDVFAMWSDGLSDSVSGKFVKDRAYEQAEKIAHNLVNELGKQYDDASCIVFKWLA